jgi:thiol-disulfide isomerase/thioredoxin
MTEQLSPMEDSMSDDHNTTGDPGDAATESEVRFRTGLVRSIAHWLADDAGRLPFEGRLASFDGATGWLNTEPLTPEGLRGRVVLVDFWTYTCVNWLRTLPYVRAWAAKYEEAGLTVVGVHTPEFGFESDLDNVVAQSRNLGIEYPIAIDSDYRVWGEFSNHFWPAVYIADPQGLIRHHHFGEGEYAQTEMVIQRLLLDAGAEDLDQDLVAVEPRGLEVAADWQALRSPETYLGYIQSRGFASEGVAAFDLPHEYAAASWLPLNSWDLTGNWTVARHAAILNESGGRITFQFHARDLNLVMGPSVAGTSIPFLVTLDGAPVDDAYGSDVEANGQGIVRDQNTYQLIRQSGPIDDHRFEIEFLEAGAEAYCFAFG